MPQTKQRRPGGGGVGGAERPGQAAPAHHTATSPAGKLLHRLDGVRETGPGRWSARCPAHDDRHPSLSIREAGDGVLLLRCWAGCTAAAVVGACGLALADLFPRLRPGEQGAAPLRRGERWMGADALWALSADLSVVVLAAADMGAGRALSAEDRQRLHQAAARLGRALDEVRHG